MTDKQKQAVELLNNIRGKKDSEGEWVMNAEEYLMLLEFIIGEQPQQQITYVPYVPDSTPQYPWYQPVTPLYQPNPLDPPYRVTCGGNCQTSTFSVNNGKSE